MTDILRVIEHMEASGCDAATILHAAKAMLAEQTERQDRQRMKAREKKRAQRLKALTQTNTNAHVPGDNRGQAGTPEPVSTTATNKHKLTPTHMSPGTIGDRPEHPSPPLLPPFFPPLSPHPYPPPIIPPSSTPPPLLMSGQEFNHIWRKASRLMRTRSSMKKAMTAFSAAQAATGRSATEIETALERYLDSPDAKRGYGHPGLHRWLQDRRFEDWLSDDWRHGNDKPDGVDAALAEVERECRARFERLIARSGGCAYADGSAPPDGVRDDERPNAPADEGHDAGGRAPRLRLVSRSD